MHPDVLRCHLTRWLSSNVPVWVSTYMAHSEQLGSNHDVIMLLSSWSFLEQGGQTSNKPINKEKQHNLVQVWWGIKEFHIISLHYDFTNTMISWISRSSDLYKSQTNPSFDAWNTSSCCFAIKLCLWAASSRPFNRSRKACCCCAPQFDGVKWHFHEGLKW